MRMSYWIFYGVIVIFLYYRFFKHLPRVVLNYYTFLRSVELSEQMNEHITVASSVSITSISETQTSLSRRFLEVCDCTLLVCKWLGVYLCMRESPSTTPAVVDKYNVVIVHKGICWKCMQLFFGFFSCGFEAEHFLALNESQYACFFVTGQVLCCKTLICVSVCRRPSVA